MNVPVRRRSVVVLGAGTELGKTHVSCALLREARAAGLSVRALKPVMSGFSPDAFAESDAGRLAAACALDPDGAEARAICRYAFEAPLAPNVAARKDGVAMSADDIVAFARAGLAEGADFTLLEGAGGVLSPITDEMLNADLAARLGAPIVLVTANYLGAVSHTLTALESCERRGLETICIAISQPSPDFGAPIELAEELRRWTRRPCLSFAHGEAGAAAERQLLSLI